MINSKNKNVEFNDFDSISQKGFIIPLLIGIIAILIIGGGIYIYSTKKAENNNPLIINSNLPTPSNQVSTTSIDNTVKPSIISLLPNGLIPQNTSVTIMGKDFALSGNIISVGYANTVANYRSKNKEFVLSSSANGTKIIFTPEDYGIVGETQAVGGGWLTVITPNGVSNSINLEVVKAPVAQTTDWKTYTSTRYGFSFQYPSQWKPIACPTFPSGWKQTENNAVLECTYDSRAIYIDLGNQTSNLNMIIYPNGNWDEFLRSTPVYGILKPVTINGYNAVGKDGQIGIQNPNGGYIILNFKIQTTGDMTAFNQIISTFKFTN